MAGRILPITRKRFVMSDRAEFEKWYDEATDCNYGVAYYVDITGRYCHHDIGIAWQAWQAALAKSRQCAEPVAEVWPSHHYVRQNHVNWLVDVDDLPNGAELYTHPQPAQQEGGVEPLKAENEALRTQLKEYEEKGRALMDMCRDLKARVAEYEALTDEMDMATRHCYLSGPTVVGQFKRLRQQADEAEQAGGEK